MPDKAPTIATVLREMGYATGQFGKNHLGDLNKYLPTLHGFDEFFGYLYHLDAMQDPFVGTMSKEERKKYGPRNILHTWATDKDDATVDPRWGEVGKQKIVDEGPLPPHPIGPACWALASTVNPTRVIKRSGAAPILVTRLGPVTS